MDGEGKDNYDCSCDESFWPNKDEEENRQIMLAQPELLIQRKTDASLKVFTTVMLHTWRQRRKEVRELQDFVQRLQISSMKSKSQLHVYGTLMRVEQKRNSELQMQLKQYAMSIDKEKSSCELLASSVRNLTTEKLQLQTDLEKRKKENDKLEEMSGETKKLLFTARLEQSQLQKQLTDEQRANQDLQLENEQLLKEVVLAENKEAKYIRLKNQYDRELSKKDDRIRDLGKDITMLEEKLRILKDENRTQEKIQEILVAYPICSLTKGGPYEMARLLCKL
ncbi:outer dense fiber protein 2 isoform X2 [Drosophila ficusphila]|uniref:outer dense fiber protein 2 isoform X2 n=1 Tax=Drosophila ficusphila TaxID=30025 RepID=UPI001C8A6EB4|nr:outer dense fiber protein 2 isoform X2 [Drosophila ficusphila]